LVPVVLAAEVCPVVLPATLVEVVPVTDTLVLVATTVLEPEDEPEDEVEEVPDEALVEEAPDEALDDRQLSDPGCTVKAALWAVRPLLSRAVKPREVPEVKLTVQVSEVPDCWPKLRRAAAEG